MRRCNHFMDPDECELCQKSLIAFHGVHECPSCGWKVDSHQFKIGELVVCRCGFIIGRSTGDGVEGIVYGV